MIDLGIKLAAEPDRADRGRILVARAVRRKRFGRDDYEIVGRLTGGSAAAEGIFARAAFGFKTNILQDDWIVQKCRPFLRKGCRKLDLGAPQEKRSRKGNERCQTHDHTLGRAPYT